MNRTNCLLLPKTAHAGKYVAKMSSLLNWRIFQFIVYSGISIFVNRTCLAFTTNLNELILFFWAQFTKEPLDVVIIKLVIWTSNQKHFEITHNLIKGKIVHVSPDWGLKCKYQQLNIETNSCQVSPSWCHFATVRNACFSLLYEHRWSWINFFLNQKNIPGERNMFRLNVFH